MATPLWERVKELFQAALEQPPEMRSRFVAEACEDDANLRREVESLLVAHRLADDFAERPALDAFLTSSSGRPDSESTSSASLAPGLRLGAYEILERVGRGGMGEVYRARDTRLQRTVAIKVLSPSLASDVELKRRFEREARALATLSHRHLCQVFDVGEHDGLAYLVMEYLEGETLATRLVRGALPLDQALRYAAQIADALEQAHRKGVIHRDVKPGNVMVSARGAVLVDFGLAKRLRTSVSPDARDIAASAAMTGAGAIVGTLQYMAPEQIVGKEADARSDVFSLGATLYEMVTGVRAFGGDSTAKTIVDILEHDPPPPSTRTPLAPMAVNRLVMTCLAKDPDARWQSMGDLARQLTWGAEDSAKPAMPSVHRPRRFTPLMPALAATVAVLLIAGAMWVYLAAKRPDLPVIRSVIDTGDDQVGAGISRVRGLAIASDGTRIAYESRGLAGPLHLRFLDRLESQPLPGTVGGSSPVFAPDGNSLAFFDQQASVIKRVSIFGGAPTVVVKTDGLVTGLSWGAGDTIVFATEASPGLVRVSAGGGSPEQLTMAARARGESSHRWPSVLPNGRAVLFTAWHGSADSSQIAVVSLDTRAVKYLVPGGTHPVYSPTGHIVYAAGGALRAVPFDMERLTITDTIPLTVVNGVRVHTTGAAQFDLAATGSLVYAPSPAASGNDLTTLVWVTRDGRETPLALAPGRYRDVRVAPDGGRIAIGVAAATQEIWVSNPAQTALMKLPGPRNDTGWGLWAARWTPDGRRLVFQDDVGRMAWTLADGTGAVEPLLTIPNMVVLMPSTWTPDRQLLFSYGTQSDIRIGAVRFDDEERPERSWRVFIDRGGKASGADLRPAGDLIAYQSSDSGKSEIYVERYPDLSDRQAVSGSDGGFHPVWSANGQELFYRRRGDGAMMVVRVSGRSPFSFAAPQVLYAAETYLPIAALSASGRTWDLAPDGRFLMIKLSPRGEIRPNGQLIHVQNWSRELSRLGVP